MGLGAAISGVTGLAGAAGDLLGKGKDMMSGAGELASAFVKPDGKTTESQNSNGINGAADSTKNRVVEGLKSIRDVAQIKDETYRLMNPEKHARKMGRADRAYENARHPGTTFVERLGNPGISGAMNSAGTGASAAHRQQAREDKFFNANLNKLDAETKKIVLEGKHLAEQTKSEHWRAFYAQVREEIAALPSNYATMMQKAPDILPKFWKDTQDKVKSELTQTGKDSYETVHGAVKWYFNEVKKSPARMKEAGSKFKSMMKSIKDGYFRKPTRKGRRR